MRQADCVYKTGEQQLRVNSCFPIVMVMKTLGFLAVVVVALSLGMASAVSVSCAGLLIINN